MTIGRGPIQFDASGALRQFNNENRFDFACLCREVDSMSPSSRTKMNEANLNNALVISPLSLSRRNQWGVGGERGGNVTNLYESF